MENTTEAPAKKRSFFRRRIIPLLGVLALISGVMGFFGIPGLFPAFIKLTEPELSDAKICEASVQEKCTDMLLREAPEGPALVGDRITLASDIALQPNSIILANEIDLGGNTITGESEMIVIAREIRNGVIKVVRPIESVAKGDRDGEDGLHGGSLFVAVGQVPSSVIFDASGTDGTAGANGPNGGDGRDGECDAFGYKGNRPGKKGGNGGAGGAGGDGGSLDLWYVTGPVAATQTLSNAGNGGASGAGGQGGRGGDGCVGPGGSQDRDKDGLNGEAGLVGQVGQTGKSRVHKMTISEFVDLSKSLPTNEPMEYESLRQIISALTE